MFIFISDKQLQIATQICKIKLLSEVPYVKKVHVQYNKQSVWVC